MPLYEYECDSCGNKEERLQTIDEVEAGIDTPTVCAGCDGHYVRLIGHASIGICDTNLLRDSLKSRYDFDDKSDDRGPLYAAKAKAAGVDTTGRWYHPGLAVELGDPMAWVGSMDEIKERCKLRGWEYSIVDGEIRIGIPSDLSKPLVDQTKHVKVGT